MTRNRIARIAIVPSILSAWLVWTAARPGGAAPGKGPVVAGQPFTTRVIYDRQQGNLAVGVMSVPASWNFDSRVMWDYSHHSSPVAVTTSAVSPGGEDAFFSYGWVQFFDLRPGGYFTRGQNYGGLVYAAPQPGIRTLVDFVQRVRGREAKLTLVGAKDLPGLPAALSLPHLDNQHGYGVKVAYESHGRPIEEEFYGVSYLINIPYDGPQGRTWQTNWGLEAVHSFRGPVGSLDARRPMFAAIAKSFRPNPAWEARFQAISQYLAAEFNRQLQAGYDQIAAAGRLSRQISANNDAMIASIDRQLAAGRSSGRSGRSSDRSGAFDDYIRGVDTTNDPYYGTSQHSSNSQFHWTDGYGNYRNTNDASADPNRTEVGNWTLLQNIR
jgi:hypothetical protein